MEGTYEILLGREPIGKAKVTRQGLYYSFDCSCRLTGSVLYKLVITCGGQEEDLGILVPQEEYFGLKTKLPVKRFREEEPVFSAVPRHTSVKGKFVPIHPDEPFSYLSQLEKAFLTVREGKVGVILPQEQEL